MPINLPSCNSDLSQSEFHLSPWLSSFDVCSIYFRTDPNISAFPAKFLKIWLLPALSTFCPALCLCLHLSSIICTCNFLTLLCLCHYSVAPLPSLFMANSFSSFKTQLRHLIFCKSSLSPDVCVCVFYWVPLALEQHLPCCAVILNPPLDWDVLKVRQYFVFVQYLSYIRYYIHVY